MVLQRDTLSEPSTSSQPEASYIFTHKAVFSELLQKVPCKYCTNCTLVIKQHHSMEYSTKMELLCESCHESYGSVFSSFQEEAKNSHDINRKLVSAFLSIGRGHAALETFSSVLNMPTMDRKTFAKCMHNLSVKNKEEIIDVSVSYDGTWQKRGHTSNLGLGIIIDILSGLVLDFEVLSKYCHNCVVAGRDMGVDSAEFHIWQKGHADECDKNFDGTSGAMEMHAALIMWRRSISDCQMRFVSMLSDGDSKTFQFLSDNKIYGSDIKIEKEECLNHIAKRLGTSLRNKVKEWKVKKVTLGGRKQGSLTDKSITKLQNYYRKAIKDNVPDTDKMKTAIYASLMHCSSTDKKPMHGKCREGESSWCFYKRAIAKDDETDEDEDNNNNNEISKDPSNADAFSVLEKAIKCPFPTCDDFQYSYSVRFHILHGSHSVFGYPNNRVSERCPVPIDSGKRRSTSFCKMIVCLFINITLRNNTKVIAD
ncbi:uncharacterized protein TNCV_2467241 [Trichonephila clavipes]|nr:uncharacterized protein TNCV_2467241 [Trichonephila clavipes]